MFFGKEVRIRLKGQAQEAYLELKKRKDKEALILLRSIHRIIDILKENPQFGDPIRKQLIPQKVLEMGVQNLYRAISFGLHKDISKNRPTEVNILVYP